MGFGYDRPWRFRSWDRFAMPRPSRVPAAVVSPMMHDPARLGPRRARALSAAKSNEMLNRLTRRSRSLGRSRHAQSQRIRPPPRTGRRRPRHRARLAVSAAARYTDGFTTEARRHGVGRLKDSVSRKLWKRSSAIQFVIRTSLGIQSSPFVIPRLSVPPRLRGKSLFRIQPTRVTIYLHACPPSFFPPSKHPFCPSVI